MNRRKFRIIILLGILAVAGLIATQVYWLNRAVELKDRQFDARVKTALGIVAQQISHHKVKTQPVEKIGDFQYIVYINDVMDPNVLSQHLKRELAAFDIKQDFVYTMFDCSNRSTVCEDYVVYKDTDMDFTTRSVPWPEQNMDNYYFGVYFPDGDGFILNGLGIWTFSSVAILFVAGFFVYALTELLRQRRLSEIQRDFIDAMTHEFKTPLTTISLVGEAINNPNLAANPEKLGRYSAMIKQEVARLRDHVDTILTNAKDYERRPDLKMELVDATEFLEQIKASFADRVQQSGMTMDLSVEPGLRVMADRVHLWNMVSTLVDNALKYGGLGGHPCHIGLVGRTEKGSYAVIEVRDNGMGMDAKTTRMAGSKFFRARHDADTPKGFGLGLFYVRNMMRNHKGRMHLSSRKGAGTVVSLHFPLPQTHLAG